VSGQFVSGSLCLPVQGPSEGRSVTAGAFLAVPQRQQSQGIRFKRVLFHGSKCERGVEKMFCKYTICTPSTPRLLSCNMNRNSVKTPSPSVLRYLRGTRARVIIIYGNTPNPSAMLRRLRLGYISESWKCLSPLSSSIVPTALSHRMNDDFFDFSGIILFYIKNTNSDVWQQFTKALYLYFLLLPQPQL
jgi:hypothetical protein